MGFFSIFKVLYAPYVRNLITSMSLPLIRVLLHPFAQIMPDFVPENAQKCHFSEISRKGDHMVNFVKKCTFWPFFGAENQLF